MRRPSAPDQRAPARGPSIALSPVSTADTRHPDRSQARRATKRYDRVGMNDEHHGAPAWPLALNPWKETYGAPTRQRRPRCPAAMPAPAGASLDGRLSGEASPESPSRKPLPREPAARSGAAPEPVQHRLRPRSGPPTAGPVSAQAASPRRRPSASLRRRRRSLGDHCRVRRKASATLPVSPGDPRQHQWQQLEIVTGGVLDDVVG